MIRVCSILETISSSCKFWQGNLMRITTHFWYVKSVNTIEIWKEGILWRISSRGLFILRINNQFHQNCIQRTKLESLDRQKSMLMKFPIKVRILMNQSNYRDLRRVTMNFKVKCFVKKMQNRTPNYIDFRTDLSRKLGTVKATEAIW